MPIHDKKSPYAGRCVEIRSGRLAGQYVLVEDWWDRVSGKSWKGMVGHAGVLDYAIRAGHDRVPPDDEVLYGKVGVTGKILHVSQLRGGRDADV